MTQYELINININIYIYIYAVIYLEIPRNSIAALLCQKAIFSMLRRNARSDIVIIFWAIHSYVWTTLGLKGKDVHLNWCDVLEPGFGVFFPEETTNGNITESCRRNSQTLRRNFPTLRRNFLEP